LPVASAEETTGAQERDAFSTLDLAQTRADALAAMQRAAQWLSIDACALSTDAYRAFRETETALRTPSPITISILFGGWQRAREHLATSQYDDAAVEEETIRAIYGDPACRHRAYGTTNAGRATPSCLNGMEAGPCS
jgi:hypothetical protein